MRYVRVNPVATTYILVGPPSIGKSTWVRRNLPNAFVINRDDLVEQVGGENDLTYNQMFEPKNKPLQDEVNRRLEKRFQVARSQPEVVVDMTNMSTWARKNALDKLGRNRQAIAVVFDFRGHENEVIRSAQRRTAELRGEKEIPLPVLQRMMQQFEYPTRQEGFSEIVVVDPTPALYR